MRAFLRKRSFLRHLSLACLFTASGLLAVVATASSAVMAQQETPSKDPLPEADGKTVVTQKCTQCHDAARFATQRHSEDEWDQLIGRMKSNGLSVTDEEYGIILNYLSKNLGTSSAPRSDGHD